MLAILLIYYEYANVFYHDKMETLVTLLVTLGPSYLGLGLVRLDYVRFGSSTVVHYAGLCNCFYPSLDISLVLDEIYEDRPKQ